MPDKLSVCLTAALVDNAATQAHRTRVQIVVENSTGRLRAEGPEPGSRSVHEFTVTDATEVGLGGTHRLTPTQASAVLAIACSLSQPRVLFAPSQPAEFCPEVEPGERDSETEPIGAVTGSHELELADVTHIVDEVRTCLTACCSLDESRIIGIAADLLRLGVFQDRRLSLVESSLVGSVERYYDAVLSPETVSAYTDLYSALEKAVNAGGPDRTGGDFDAEAAKLTGLAPVEVEELRKLNDRVKHAPRNPKDVAYLKAKRAELPRLLASLKRATDQAITSKL